MLKIIPLAFLSLAACAPALAQQHDGTRMLDQMEKADANGDGAVSRTEFTAFRASQFGRLDRNKDGFITDSDIPKMVQSRLPAEMSGDKLRASFDANKDGKVSEAEFVNGPSVLFDRADTNGDNMVSKAELNAMRTALANRQ